MAPTPAEDPLAFLSRGLLESLDGGGSSGAAHHSQQQGGSSSSAGAFHPPPSSSNGALSGESVSSSMLMSHHGRQPAPSALHLQHRPFVPSPQQGGSGGFGEPLDQRGLPHSQQMYEGSRSIDFDRGQSMLDDGGGGYGRHLQPGQGYAYSQQQQQQQSHSASRSPYPPMSQFETHSPTTSVHLGPYGEPDGYPPPPSGAGGLYYPQSQHSLPPDPLYGNHHQQQQQQPPLRQASMPPSSASQGGFGPSGFQLLSPPGAPPMHFGQPPKVSQPQQQLQQQQKPLRQASMPAQGSSLALSMLPVGLGGVNPLLGQNGRFPRTGGGGPGVGGNSSPGGRAELEEEISTIFVVGFPDDMQEREFQNMFTFCAGFEAATLKLPPAQSAAIPAGTQQQPGMQNSAVAATAAAVAQAALGALAVGQAKSAESSLLLQHSGQQPFLDPAAYDPVDPAGGAPSSALGLGGFLLAPPSTAVNGAAGGPSTAVATASGPPRRQSIGFAKFKTRQAALDARDALQGRKVDVERASVLKAEMAKKNLHTRRGVGGDEAGSPSAPVSGGTGGGGSNVVGGGVAVGLGPQSQPYGAAGRSGDLSSNTSPWFNSDRPQATVEDESGRESPPVLSASSLSSTPPSHLQSPTLGLPSDTPFLHPPPLHSVGGEGSSAGSSTGGHFSGFRNGVGNGGKDGNFPLSPESFGLARSFTQSQPMDLRRSDELAAFSPPLTPGGTGVGSQALASAHLRSPSLGPQSQQQQSQAGSSSQLRPPPDDGARDSDPSSTSGSASSSFGKATGGKNLPRTANPADMNPPINTLYVGNLPTSSAPSSSNTQLEDALRALFSRCDGFRRLSYRQKTNGPMCFVEFEDVEAASMTLKALYGDTIHGLVKGGIRLSFSKHPLGQRGPASTPTASVHNGGVGGSSWTSSSSSVGSPPLAGQTISSPVIDYSLSIDHSDSSTSAGSHRHHARPPVPFGAGFGQNASTSAGQQQQRTTGSGGLPMPSRPASQNRSQSRHSSPAGALSYPPADAFPSSKAAGQVPSFPASLGRSPPQSRRGLTSSTPATNGAWNSPSFSPFGHDLDNGQ